LAFQGFEMGSSAYTIFDEGILDGTAVATGHGREVHVIGGGRTAVDGSVPNDTPAPLVSPPGMLTLAAAYGTLQQVGAELLASVVHSRASHIIGRIAGLAVAEILRRYDKLR
jgi:hypothetical protein